MGTCEIQINGKVLEVAVGKTILEAAAQAGIEIPALCYDPRLKPFGGCRMCLVEVVGARGPVAACTTPVKTGMEITTSSGEIEGLRKTALEFLLAEHYGDCLAPCQTGCPAGIDIQGFIAFIANGENAESLKLIKEALPFPASCGRVCPRFCEIDCRRNVVDDPVGIMRLKRYVADIDLDEDKPYIPERLPLTGRSVGIIGGGPAGLTAAYYLGAAGHSVTVYEACPELGGMLRYAIPEYRLPKAVLDKEIATITPLCEEVRCNTKLGRDITLEELRERHDAVLVAVGAAASQMIGVSGEALTGNYGGLDFLAKYAAGGTGIGRRVAVVGGGNTAIDCARTAVRLGAEEVTIVYRRSKSEMPADPEEIEGAEEEGVHFRFLANPISCECSLDQENMEKLVCVEMALGEPDASGRRRPQPLPGSDFIMDVDTVVWATGQTLDPEGLEELDKARNGFIVADPIGRTSLAKVFATADCVSGPTTVVEACGAAHKTALLIDAYLRDKPVELPVELYNHTKGKLDEVRMDEYEVMPKIARETVEFRPPEQRRHDYLEIDPGYPTAEALAETKRCLSCGCQDIHDCLLRDYATQYQVQQPQLLREDTLPVVADHELVVRDPNKCILCGSCVRICAEIQGASALGLTARGHKVLVQPTLGKSLSESPCESCSQCISACPTGALLPVVALPKPGPFVLNRSTSVCPECSVGCELSIGTTADRLVVVDAPLTAAVNAGNLCKHGALLPGRLAAKQRAMEPLIRVNGRLEPAGWDQALAATATALDRAVRSGDEVSLYVSSRSTVEEAALAKALAQTALGKAVVHGPSAAVAAGFTALAKCRAGFDDLRSADVIIAADADMPEHYPVAAIKVRQAVDQGAQLLILGSAPTKLERLATKTIAVKQDQVGRLLLAAVAQALQAGADPKPAGQLSAETQGALAAAAVLDIAEVCRELDVAPADLAKVAQAYAGATKPVVVAGLDDLAPQHLGVLTALIALGPKPPTGAGAIGLTRLGNARGLVAAGATADARAERSPLLDQLANSLEIEGHGGIAIAVGGGQPFAVCITPYLAGGLQAAASVVLPGSTLFEVEGSMVNSEGRTQKVASALKPPAGPTMGELVKGLAEALGYEIDAAQIAVSDDS